MSAESPSLTSAVLSPKQVATRLGYKSVLPIYRWLESGALPAYRLPTPTGKKCPWRVTEEALSAFIFASLHRGPLTIAKKPKPQLQPVKRYVSREVKANG